MKSSRFAPVPLLLVLAAGAVAQSNPTELSPPPAPKGYSNSLEVTAAIGAGQIKLIEQPKSLPPGVWEVKDVEYGRVGERPLKLDLFMPEKISRPVPGLIFIHGGAWAGGSRDMYRYYTVRYAQRGYVCATISYRFYREAPYPAAVQDAKCAVRWLRASAAQYHVDPDKIGVVGGSAGGHLAMMVGYSSDVPELEGDGGHHDVSSRVQTVVNFYGPTDLTTPFAKKSKAVRQFLGDKPYEEAKTIYEQASPLMHLTKDDPPTLIIHGTIDDVVPIDQADALARKLKELGVPHVYDRLEGWPHALDVAEVVNERCRFFMDQFFAKYLPLPK
jgi:acetyl esterase/lipase